MNSTTFLMTNMVPQLHELNAGPWEKLEQHERELAEAPDAELYVVAGGIFDANPPTIGHGVAVPKANFKIITVLKTGQVATDVTDSTEVVAVEGDRRETSPQIVHPDAGAPTSTKRSFRVTGRVGSRGLGVGPTLASLVVIGRCGDPPDADSPPVFRGQFGARHHAQAEERAFTHLRRRPLPGLSRPGLDV
jgi:hypothetical protein